MGKGQTEQFTARIDARLYKHIERLAERERRSKNEVLNLLLKLGLIELSKKKGAKASTPAPESHSTCINNVTEKHNVTT